MALDDFLDTPIVDEKYAKFLSLKDHLKVHGMPERLATYKALEVLTPEKLEKIKLMVKNEDGLRYGVTFYFDSEEELQLIAKYFKFNPNVKQVREAKLLLDILRMMEELNGD